MTTLDKSIIILIFFISFSITSLTIYSITKEIKHLNEVTFGSSQCPK